MNFCCSKLPLYAWISTLQLDIVKLTLTIKWNLHYTIYWSVFLVKYFFLNQNATFTSAIKAGTSTNGPITPVKA